MILDKERNKPADCPAEPADAGLTFPEPGIEAGDGLPTARAFVAILPVPLLATALAAATTGLS